MFAESDGGQSQRGTGTRDPDKRGGKAEVPGRASASSEHQWPKPSAAAGYPASDVFSFFFSLHLQLLSKTYFLCWK